MNAETPKAPTVQLPKYSEGPSDVTGDVSVRIRYVTYQTDQGLVAGRNNNDVFIIDKPAKDVWPYFKDFNVWQTGYGYHYTGVVGDLEGSAVRIVPINTPKDNNANETMLGTPYEVLKVVPEHLIILYQPPPEDGSTGGISPGFHVFTLNEQAGKTVVTIFTSHASRAKDKTEEELLTPFRSGAEETLRKFRDSFIPALKKAVYDGKPVTK